MEESPRATWARESPTRQMSIEAWWGNDCGGEAGSGGDEEEGEDGGGGGGIRAVESARAVG